MSTLSIWRNSPVLRVGLAWAGGLALLGGWLLAMGAVRSPGAALAQDLTVRYVDCAAGRDSGNGCASSSAPCATIQHAVDLADPGDEIRVAAGACTGVHARAGITQVVYITKTVTVRGGYTTTNWTASYPVTQPTTLDAQSQGRVLYIAGNISPTLEGLHITGGDARYQVGSLPARIAGGGVCAVSATVTMSHNWVMSNTAYYDGYGGGLFLLDGGATLSGNDVAYNIAKFGAGLYCDGCASVVLIGNLIHDNHAWSHGGGVQFLDASAVTLTGNEISYNKAEGGGLNHGGGARFQLCDGVTLRGNAVHDNVALNDCGGLCFESSRGIALDGNIVMRNVAGIQGGGLFLNSSRDVELVNDVVAGNRARRGGGAYVGRLSVARLLHTTVAGNTSIEPGAGSGVYIGDVSNTVAMTNTILVSHTVGITAATGNTTTLNGVLWYSNTVNAGGDITVTNAYTGPPAFAADGYHLTASSQAIDRGVTAGVEEDIDGDRRPVVGGCDLGADEFVRHIYLPLVLKSSGG